MVVINKYKYSSTTEYCINRLQICNMHGKILKIELYNIPNPKERFENP